MFMPDHHMQANAVHLAAELPLEGRGPHRVLYPASAKAGSDLQASLLTNDAEASWHASDDHLGLGHSMNTSIRTVEIRPFCS